MAGVPLGMTAISTSRGAQGRLVGVVVLSGWWACQTRPATAPAPVAPASAVASAEEPDSPAIPSVGEPKPAAAAKPECGAGGVKWNGKREGCLYEVDGCCYGTPQSACVAASCKGERCQVIETSPGQIACRRVDAVAP